jgi:hypothetical protein
VATVHIAIPVQDELECLPACLDALRLQEGVRFVTWLCVNQPEAWQHEPDRRPVCEANQACLHLLADVTDLDLRIIDRSSPGRGWPPKRSGVGHARKELMDAISAEAAPRDIIVSLDADTLTPPGYLRSLIVSFNRHPAACGFRVTGGALAGRSSGVSGSHTDNAPERGYPSAAAWYRVRAETNVEDVG